MKYNNKIINIFAIMPIIDTVNGLAIKNRIPIISNIGVIYRLALILFVITTIIKLDKNNKIIISISIFLCTIPLIHSFYHSSISGIVSDYNKLFKLGIILLLPLFFYNLIINNIVSKNIIIDIFEKLVIYFPVTIIVPFFLGIGNSLYSNGAGFKGFYFANNDITIVLLLMVLFATNAFLNELSKEKFIVLILNIFALLLTATKTSIVGIGLVLIIFLPRIIKLAFKRKRVIIFVGIGVVIGVLFSSPITREFKLTAERNSYLLNSGKMSGVDFLLGGRSTLLKNEMENSTDNLLRAIIGEGEYSRSLRTTKYSIEMDFFDSIILYGIPLTIILYLYIISEFIRYKNKFNDKRIYFTFAFVIAFGFSFFAGHVLYSALSGTIFGLILAQLKISRV